MELCSQRFKDFEEFQLHLISFLGSRMGYFTNTPKGLEPSQVCSVATIPTGCMEDNSINGAQIFFRKRTIGKLLLRRTNQ